MKLIDQILPFTNGDLTGFVPVRAAGKHVGWTPRDIAEKLGAYQNVWNYEPNGDALVLSGALKTQNQRTEAIDSVFMDLSYRGVLPVMPDYSAFGQVDWFAAKDGETAIFLIKRFYSPYLGTAYDSVVLNGFHGQHYWTSIRSNHVHDAPGKRDLISAGAVSYSHSILAALADEAYHEAGLSEHDLQTKRSMGCFHLKYVDRNGHFKDEHMHIFDLDTGGRIIPQTRLPYEVAGFELMPVQKILELLHDETAFSKQVVIVLIDFLLRHGYLDQHPEFLELQEIIHRCRLKECHA